MGRTELLQGEDIQAVLGRSPKRGAAHPAHTDNRQVMDRRGHGELWGSVIGVL
jgi:hypothetical protein